MDFSSVGDFLRQAATAKQDKRQAIDDRLTPFMEDPGTVGIPPVLATSIEALLEAHGDETYRQIALFCLGKWHQIHCEVLQQHIENDGTSEMLMVMSDISKLSTVLMVLDQVGSFGGDDDWRKMLRTIVGQSVLETIEEKGISFDSIFNPDR
jgi:hypothetical protein